MLAFGFSGYRDYGAYFCAETAADALIGDLVSDKGCADSRRTLLIVNVGFVLVPEVAQRRKDRVRRGLSESAESSCLDRFGKFLELFYVAVLSFALCNGGEHFEHALRSFTAGGAFAAGFRLCEVEEELGYVHHRCPRP